MSNLVFVDAGLQLCQVSSPGCGRSWRYLHRARVCVAAIYSLPALLCHPRRPVKRMVSSNYTQYIQLRSRPLLVGALFRLGQFSLTHVGTMAFFDIGLFPTCHCLHWLVQCWSSWCTLPSGRSGWILGGGKHPRIQCSQGPRPAN